MSRRERGLGIERAPLLDEVDNQTLDGIWQTISDSKSKQEKKGMVDFELWKHYGDISQFHREHKVVREWELNGEEMVELAFEDGEENASFFKAVYDNWREEERLAPLIMEEYLRRPPIELSTALTGPELPLHAETIRKASDSDLPDYVAGFNTVRFVKLMQEIGESNPDITLFFKILARECVTRGVALPRTGYLDMADLATKEGLLK